MPISTPCIGLCTIDPRTDLCQGCGRSLGEIAAWSAFTEEERRLVMASLGARRLGADPDGYRQARRSKSSP